MILVTIGTQLPFDRLVRMMDLIAPTLNEPIFAQIGETDYEPRHMDWAVRLDAVRNDRLFGESRVVVSHAGIGTVLRADRARKPLVLVPRLATFGEHRDNHQVDTCDQLADIPGIYVANEQAEIATLLTAGALDPVDLQGHTVRRTQLIENIRNYLRANDAG